MKLSLRRTLVRSGRLLNIILQPEVCTYIYASDLIKKMKIVGYSLIIIAFLGSCQNRNEHIWSELPEARNISEFRQTQFVPTLENPIEDSNKNTVYATAFLYAWDELRQKLATPIKLVAENSQQFKILNQSISFKNTLAKDEYDVESETSGNRIIAKAFFNKTLPFPTKLHQIDHGIRFNMVKVDAFGMEGYDEEVARFARILYYKNDENFILKLIPKDNEHEIELVKGITNVKTLSEAVERANQLINTGRKEKLDSKQSWKYYLNKLDIFSIPTIKFNIENNYHDIEGQTFIANNKNYFIETAYQRTGFILNENGAVVESYALTTTDTTAAEPVIKPKKMIFDKPFFVIIKRAKSKNPYFVMHVRNSELLTKQ
jgi:hypothetical protein